MMTYKGTYGKEEEHTTNEHHVLIKVVRQTLDRLRPARQCWLALACASCSPG